MLRLIQAYDPRLKQARDSFIGAGTSLQYLQGGERHCPVFSWLQMQKQAPLLRLWGCLQRPPPPLPPRPRGIERPGRGYGQEPSESEAGPQAVQAAEQARQAFGRGRGGMDGRGIVSVESLMDEIIDRAYDEDDEMGVRLPAEAKQHDCQQRSVSVPLLVSAYTQALSSSALRLARPIPTCRYLHARAIV